MKTDKCDAYCQGTEADSLVKFDVKFITLEKVIHWQYDIARKLHPMFA